MSRTVEDAIAEVRKAGLRVWGLRERLDGEGWQADVIDRDCKGLPVNATARTPADAIRFAVEEYQRPPRDRKAATRKPTEKKPEPPAPVSADDEDLF